MPIDPNRLGQLARIDNNLMVIKDKIDEAERISGGTRSAFLESLDLDESKRTLTPKKSEKKTIAIKVMLEIEDGEVSLLQPEKEIDINPTDPMDVRGMLKEKRFKLLRSRGVSRGLLTS